MGSSGYERKSIPTKIMKKIAVISDKNLCKIYLNNIFKGIGFFCEIPFNDKTINSLIINTVLNKSDILNTNNFEISFGDNKERKGLLYFPKRKFYSSEKYKITIIELIPDKDIFPNNFFKFNKTFKKKDEIFIFEYKDNEYEASFINIIDEITIHHIKFKDKFTDRRIIGCPILLLNTFEIIGIIENEKNGYKLEYLINEFAEKYYKKQYYLNNSLLTEAQYETIYEQQEKSLCDINIGNSEKGKGFLCKIPFPDEFNFLRVLVTCNKILGEKDISENNELKLFFNDEKKEKIINVTSERKLYINELYDITFIEIFENDGLDNFLDIEQKLKKNKKIYFIQFPNDNENEGELISKSELIKIDNNFFEYKYQTKYSNNGCPIFLLDNYKVIGINTKKNSGTLLSIPIQKFNEKYKNIKYEQNNRSCVNEQNFGITNNKSCQDNLINQNNILTLNPNSNNQNIQKQVNNNDNNNNIYNQNMISNNIRGCRYNNYFNNNNNNNNNGFNNIYNNSFNVNQNNCLNINNNYISNNQIKQNMYFDNNISNNNTSSGSIYNNENKNAIFNNSISNDSLINNTNNSNNINIIFRECGKSNNNPIIIINCSKWDKINDVIKEYQKEKQILFLREYKYNAKKIDINDCYMTVENLGIKDKECIFVIPEKTPN